MLTDTEPEILLGSPADFQNPVAVQRRLVFIFLKGHYLFVSAGGGVCTHAIVRGGGSQTPAFRSLLPPGIGD